MCLCVVGAYVIGITFACERRGCCANNANTQADHKIRPHLNKHDDDDDETSYFWRLKLASLSILSSRVCFSFDCFGPRKTRAAHLYVCVCLSRVECAVIMSRKL